jgi:hypothetical protein
LHSILTIIANINQLSIVVENEHHGNQTYWHKHESYKPLREAELHVMRKVLFIKNQFGNIIVVLQMSPECCYLAVRVLAKKYV